jgi:methyl-accepting chemotaxis protein
MLSRFEKVGSLPLTYHHPRLIQARIRTKLSVAFLLVIILLVFLISTDISYTLRYLGTLEQIPPELIKSIGARVTINTLLVGLYSLSLIFFATRSVTSHLSRLVGGIEKISSGSLDPNPDLLPVSADQLGDLNLSIDRIRSNLSQQLEQITKQSRQVEKAFTVIRETVPVLIQATEEMITVSRKQETDSSEQPEIIRRIQGAIEGLGLISHFIEESNNSVIERAVAVREGGERGARAIENSRQSIQHIAAGVREMEEWIQTFSSLGQDVDNVLKVIEESAARGDILALNATLQGASAGQAAARFMGIADRMRKLSEEVIREANQIRPLLRQIESSTQEILDMIYGSLELVRIGSELTTQADKSLEKIYQSVESTQRVSQEISLGTQRQKDLAEEMKQHLEIVAKIAEEGSAARKDSTRVAEHLAAISKKLESLTTREPHPA